MDARSVGQNATDDRSQIEMLTSTLMMLQGSPPPPPPPSPPSPSGVYILDVCEGTKSGYGNTEPAMDVDLLIAKLGEFSTTGMNK